MNWRLVSVVVGLVTVAALAAPVAGTDACEAVDGQQVCITEIGVSSDQLTQGDEGELSVTITNDGNQTTTFRLILAVASPNNETNAIELSRPAAQRTLEPGESQTFTQPLSPETPGTHALELRLVTDDRQQRFDASDPITVEVVEPSAGLGGPIDRAEFALAALVGAVAVVGYLVYSRR